MFSYSRFLNPKSKVRQPSLLRDLHKERPADTNDHLAPVDMAGGLPHHKTFVIQEGVFTLTNGRTISITPDLMKEALQYGASDGYKPLLKQIESLTQRLHNPPCWSNTQQLVTPGSQCGLNFAIDMLMNEGDYVIIEEPCYCGVLAILNPYQPNYLPIEADAEGMKPDKLKASLSRWKPQEIRNATTGVPKFLYTNPNGCNPSGGITSAQRRKQIYQIACDYNLIILEDDPYYFIQFQEEKDFPPSFLSLDTEARVIRFDSFSKTLSAGLRVGYVTGPKPLIEKILWHQQCAGSHASVLSQMIISKTLEVMGEDGYLEHGRSIKRFYEGQKNAVLASAEKHLTGICEWLVPSGGMFLWLKIIGLNDSREVVKHLAETLQCFVVPGKGFMPINTLPSSFLRISFSLSSPEDMEEGFQRLAKAIKEEIICNAERQGS